MQYRLEKKLWKDCLLEFRNYFTFFIFSIILFFRVGSAFAALTVNPVSPYSKSTAGSTSYVYYAYSTDPPKLVSENKYVDHSSGFKSISYTVTQSNALYFDITTDLTDNSTDDYYIGVYAKLPNGDETDLGQYIPIAFAARDATTDPTSCSDCVKSASIPNKTSFAKITGSNHLRIGFYPQEICQYTSAPYGCTGLNANVPSASEATSFMLIFRIGKINDSTTVSTFENQSAEEESLTVKVVQAVPSVACEELDKAYIPGDGFVTVDLSKIKGSSSSAGAPISNTMLLGNKNGNVQTDVLTYTDNHIRTYSGYGSGRVKFSGFSNTTNGSDNNYTVTFAVRDLAGILAYNTSSCSLNNIQTAEIEGAITEGDCFIATVLFQSKDAWPVLVLRKFRDQTLVQYKWGREFIKFYYENSPQVAQWIKSRPLLGFFGVLILFPIVLLVFVLMNPVVLLFFPLVFIAFHYFKKKKNYATPTR